MVTQGLLLRISIVWLQLRWSRRKNPQRISEDTLPGFSLAPPCFVKTLNMLTLETVLTTLLGQTSWRVEDCHSRMVTQGLLSRISIV
jgi:hypothetical protein